MTEPASSSPPPPSFARLALAWLVSGPLNVMQPLLLFPAPWHVFGFEPTNAVEWWRLLGTMALVLLLSPAALISAIAIFLWARSSRHYRELTDRFFKIGLTVGPAMFPALIFVLSPPMFFEMFPMMVAMVLAGAIAAIPIIVYAIWAARLVFYYFAADS